MDAPILDLSYLHQLSDGDKTYINDIIKLFLNTIPKGLETLEKLTHETEDYDYEAVRKQAHYLKSSAHIVKVAGMHESLCKIETFAKQYTGKEEIIPILEHIITDFNVALPLILAEKERTNPRRRK